MTSLPRFRDDQLFTQALTHSSYCNEHPEVTKDNERLEFLGDAVLKFVMGKLLFEQFPQLQEGELSRLRASLENNRYQLATFATDLGLDQLLRLGKGTEKVGARQNPEILSDVFEAVVGAYFLDAGIEATIAFVEKLVLPVAITLAAKPELVASQNAKGALQEWALAHIGELPEYKILAESGADHAKTFKVGVFIQGKRYGQGTAGSKKLAQKQAAQAALQVITKGKTPRSVHQVTDEDEGDRLTLLQQLAQQNTLQN
ncbi:ribonuclease III [[Limnothrix rosea] IAM M-220]|uniref:ribonuclease III n=1 Tax=[Limnothrix rosea] IAM M-220 TaxID=454133 RepID=UPI0009635D4B|nr:ribonuclease III [[Limnothrix rosea] IAM M-220]OKH12162.1 ribonuclease III [[Limnothrix rosea] IAM M-220]